KIRLDAVPVDLRTTVEQCLESFETIAKGKNIKLSVDAPAEHVIVSADVIRLQQIIGNLLSNAIKYTDANGSVEITIRRAMGDAVVAIKDSGKGIAPEML